MGVGNENWRVGVGCGGMSHHSLDDYGLADLVRVATPSHAPAICYLPPTVVAHMGLEGGGVPELNE